MFSFTLLPIYFVLVGLLLAVIILLIINIQVCKKNEKNRRGVDQELKKKIQELKKFKMAVDGAYDHIVVTDQDANIVFANQAVKTITGYDPVDILGKNPGDLWGGQMDKKIYQQMWKTIKNKKQNYIGEIKNKRKSGEMYEAEVRIAPILGEAGKVEFFVGIERDITKIKEIDRAKNEFISVASHQLRTPLTGIKWFAELLLEQKLTPEIADYVRQISLSNERMIHLVEDLLNVSRIETGRKFDIVLSVNDVVPIVKQVISAQNILAESRKIKIMVDKNFPKKLVLDVDSEKIRQVFQNLINNSYKYSKDNSEIMVGCQIINKYAQFYIKDSGIGIATNQQRRIFEKFFRAENALVQHTDGTGLGLYIVKSIVEGHKGKVWFESEENKGTTFYFTLPVKNKK